MTSRTNDLDSFLVADSSFYVCFLNDIKQQIPLEKILTELKFYVPSCIVNEVSKCSEFKSILSSTKAKILDSSYNFADILRPFVSKNQFDKGETEAIALAYVLNRMQRLHKLILDDKGARDFVINKLSLLANYMTGTVGFVADCCCYYCFLTREEGLRIFELVELSQFRVDNNVLSQVRDRVNGC